MIATNGLVLLFIPREVVPNGNNIENQTYKMFPTGTTSCAEGSTAHNFKAAKHKFF